MDTAIVEILHLPLLGREHFHLYKGQLHLVRGTHKSYRSSLPCMAGCVWMLNCHSGGPCQGISEDSHPQTSLPDSALWGNAWTRDHRGPVPPGLPLGFASGGTKRKQEGRRRDSLIPGSLTLVMAFTLAVTTDSNSYTQAVSLLRHVSPGF